MFYLENRESIPDFQSCEKWQNYLFLKMQICKFINCFVFGEIINYKHLRNNKLSFKELRFNYLLCHL
jgi:hypothetical protein